MNEKNDFALVPRPPIEIEKAESGTKRVLSGMVVETLALARREAELVEVIYQRGLRFEKQGEHAEAFDCFKRAAERRHLLSQYKLGCCYDFGNGVPQNSVEAAKWYRESAEQGLAISQFMTGDCYRVGEGVQQNMQEAVKWYRKAADQGLSTAQVNLAMCYRHGQGVPQDMAEAAKWYYKAAEQGDAEAQSTEFRII